MSTTYTNKSGTSFVLPEGYCAVEHFHKVLRLNLKTVKGNARYARLVDQYEADLAAVEEFLEEKQTRQSF